MPLSVPNRSRLGQAVKSVLASTRFWLPPVFPVFPLRYTGGFYGYSKYEMTDMMNTIGGTPPLLKGFPDIL